VEARSLTARTITLIAVAMVHGADKCGATATALAAIITVLAVLSALPSLPWTLLALVLSAKVTSASPRLAIAWVLRLVQSFIHSYTCELWFYPPDVQGATWV